MGRGKYLYTTEKLDMVLDKENALVIYGMEE